MYAGGWDARAAMDRVAHEANELLGDSMVSGQLIDETGFKKQGGKSA